MINLHNLTKFYSVGWEKKYIANNLSMVIPQNKTVGLFGRNGAGKSTILRIIAGIENPTSGRVIREGSISWPIGLAGSFHPELSGMQNLRFVARIYGVDTEELIEFVKEFSDLGPHFHAPFRTYSAGMRARLGFGMAMGINFDTYLIDEVTSVGDVNFRKQSSAMLKSRLNERGAIIVSHSMGLMKQLCDSGIVLINGRAKFFDEVGEAISIYEGAMRGEMPDWVKENA